jgi:hypothetical protein
MARPCRADSTAQRAAASLLAAKYACWPRFPVTVRTRVSRGRVHPFAERRAAWFQGGEARLEVVQTCRAGDLAVIAAIERQHGVVGGLPEQDWSLRVTLVFRRDDGEWRLVHRHADALVHTIDHAQLSVLARGTA